MCCKGWYKKVVPFFLTLFVGLFITSLFVSVAAPSFSFKKRDWKKHKENHRRIDRENRELRLENLRLEQKIVELERLNKLENTFEIGELDFDVPPPALQPIPPAKSR